MRPSPTCRPMRMPWILSTMSSAWRKTTSSNLFVETRASAPSWPAHARASVRRCNRREAQLHSDSAFQVADIDDTFLDAALPHAAKREKPDPTAQPVLHDTL